MSNVHAPTGNVRATRENDRSVEVNTEAARERLHPEPDQPHYLHLNGVREGLDKALALVGPVTGPSLDLYCGVQPYRSIIPGPPIGVDIDRHYGAADLIADVPLPFADDEFALITCLQALYFRTDDREVVAELRRVCHPDGAVIVSNPLLYRREGFPFERRYTVDRLESIFADWSDVRLLRAGSIGTGASFFAGCWLNAINRRAALPAAVNNIVSRGINGAGQLVDAAAGRIEPVAEKFPATIVVVARP